VDSLFGAEVAEPQQHAGPGAPRPGLSRGVFDRSFPVRVAALLRSRPLADLAAGAARQEWPQATYDVATLALAAIDLVIAHQGFEDEATYDEVVEGLMALAARAGTGRPATEHERVARYTVDFLLNRPGREAPFTYRISDYAAGTDHRQRQVQFRLLVEREDPVRGVVVLNATGDAINALVGGLEFDVEDEQVANEILMERQLARGSFDAAERAAVRARLLSVSLAESLTTVIKETQRDVSSVLDDWASTVPASLDQARQHLRGRVDADHRLLTKVRESVASDDPGIAEISARIAALLEEARRRHQRLHQHVIDARSVFLEEQNRQSFRPPALGYLPELGAEVLTPMLSLPADDAIVLSQSWLTDVSGPRVPRLPRLYRLINDLWTFPAELDDVVPAEPEDEIGLAEVPLIRPESVDAAGRAVARVGLPARLSALIAACLTDPETLQPHDRQQAAEITALAALWCFSPEDPVGTDDQRADLATRVLGPRAAVDADDLMLALPGWDGDDLIVAPYADALATADPEPVTDLSKGLAAC
jgi:hypothetical protein